MVYCLLADREPLTGVCLRKWMEWRRGGEATGDRPCLNFHLREIAGLNRREPRLHALKLLEWRVGNWCHAFYRRPRLRPFPSFFHIGSSYVIDFGLNCGREALLWFTLLTIIFALIAPRLVHFPSHPLSVVFTITALRLQSLQGMRKKNNDSVHPSSVMR